MKTLKRSVLGGLALVAGALLSLAILHDGPPARAADVNNLTFALWPSNACPSVVTLSTTTNINSGAVALRPHRGIALLLTTASQSPGTLLTTFNFDVSIDGTNYSTTAPISLGLTGNGTNTVAGFTNISASAINNARYIRLGNIINGQTNNLTNVSIMYGISDLLPGGSGF